MVIRATFNGSVIAKSDDRVVVEGNHCFPFDAVNHAYLEPSSIHMTCRLKGLASSCHVVVDGQEVADAGRYADPMGAAKEIEDRIAFWSGVATG